MASGDFFEVNSILANYYRITSTDSFVNFFDTLDTPVGVQLSHD